MVPGLNRGQLPAIQRPTSQTSSLAPCPLPYLNRVPRLSGAAEIKWCSGQLDLSTTLFPSSRGRIRTQYHKANGRYQAASAWPQAPSCLLNFLEAVKAPWLVAPIFAAYTRASLLCVYDSSSNWLFFQDTWDDLKNCLMIQIIFPS